MAQTPDGTPGIAYMTKTRSKIVIACEESDFIWDKDEVEEFKELWHRGYTVGYMMHHFYRTGEEMLFLIIDQGNKGKIKPRSFYDVFREIQEGESA